MNLARQTLAAKIEWITLAKQARRRPHHRVSVLWLARRIALKIASDAAVFVKELRGVTRGLCNATCSQAYEAESNDDYTHA